uniref:Ion transport domain-containing protein n=1 Tax=Rhizochromulina marina TaxID=1034831 RepID=A0A7S2WA63_9STRA|mmetsp:Transcript_18135/g.52990  ORF Transcript_18135/g.52990 Transcript_18135/m.52990 type:complete len:317 (+) Transcript_18135:58-1008(+)
MVARGDQAKSEKSHSLAAQDAGDGAQEFDSEPEEEEEDPEAGHLLRGGRGSAPLPAEDRKPWRSRKSTSRLKDDDVERRKQRISEVLDSSGYWLAVMLVVLVDLGSFVWQVVFKETPLLRLLELMVSSLFIGEMFLRWYVREFSSPTSCIQIFDAVIVVTAFSLSVFSIHNPLLAGRSARLLLLVRGGSRISRAVTKSVASPSLSQRDPHAAEVELQPASKAVRSMSESVAPLCMVPSPALREALDAMVESSALSSRDLSGIQLALERCGDRSSHRPWPILAVDILARTRHKGPPTEPDLRSLLRGSRLHFPGKKL